jgi:hypothetical protein
MDAARIKLPMILTTHNAHKPVAITMLWAKTSIQLFITLLYSPLFFFLDYGLSFSIAQ